VLRVLRVLRVLKAIDFIPSLKRLATTLVRSLPYIFHVGILLAIFYLVFGLVGVELFGGYLHQRCVDPEGLWYWKSLN
jgi:voltage-gated sodium channel